MFETDYDFLETVFMSSSPFKFLLVPLAIPRAAI